MKTITALILVAIFYAIYNIIKSNNKNKANGSKD